MGKNVFDDYKSEYWFHVSDQNEIPIYCTHARSIDVDLLHAIAIGMPAGEKDSSDYLKNVVKANVDSIDILRTVVGVTEKRMYLELSYLFNKYVDGKEDGANILGETVYLLKKHNVNYFKKCIKKDMPKQALEIMVKYLVDKGLVAVLGAFRKISKEELKAVVDFLLLPKEIQQEETKRRGHGAEQALAILLFELGVAVIPENKHEPPMGADDPNVDKVTFELAARNEQKTWSMDLIVKAEERLKVFVQALIHSSDPGQYGVNKSGETVLVKKDWITITPQMQTRRSFGGL